MSLAGSIMRMEERINELPKAGITSAGAIQVCAALLRREIQRRIDYGFFGIRRIGHVRACVTERTAPSLCETKSTNAKSRSAMPLGVVVHPGGSLDNSTTVPAAERL